MVLNPYDLPIPGVSYIWSMVVAGMLTERMKKLPINSPLLCNYFPHTHMKKQKKKSDIKTYYVTHIITIVQEIPARDEEEAIERMNEMMMDGDHRAALTEEGCTSSSTTDWEMEARDAEEQDEYENS